MGVFLGLAFAIGIALGGGGVSAWDDYWSTKAAKAQQEAQVKLEAEISALKANAENHIIDMQASYDAGRRNAEKRTGDALTKGAKNVTTYPVFSNPQCVLPPDVLLDLNGARASVRSATDPGVAAPSVPGAGAPRKR